MTASISRPRLQAANVSHRLRGSWLSWPRSCGRGGGLSIRGDRPLWQARASTASPSLDTGHNSGIRSLIAILPAVIFDQASFCEPEPTPPAVRPEPLPHGHLGMQERAVTRLWLAGKIGWGTILDNAPPFHNQHPIKHPGL